MNKSAQWFDQHFNRNEWIVREDESLKNWTTFCLESKADLIVSPKHLEQLRALMIQFAKDGWVIKRDWDMIGRGSNILVADEGFGGVLVDLSKGFDQIEIESQNDEGMHLRVQAGVANGTLFTFVRQHSLTGFEFGFGIPGSVGGSVAMNAGTPMGWFGQLVKEVKTISQDGSVEVLKVSEKDFQYRQFGALGKRVIADVLMVFKRGIIDQIEQKIFQAKSVRMKQPLELPNFGSVFKNPEGDFAGRLIEQSGLKGFQIGQAQISIKHANFIVNLGGAKTKDVLELISIAKEKVKKRFNVQLEPEVRLLGGICEN